MKQYKTQYGTIFAVKDHNGAPAIMCRAELSETWSLSSMIEPFTPGAWTAEELQARLDSWAATKGLQPVAEPASAEPPEIVDEGSGPEEECPYLQPLENSKKYNCQCSICEEKFANREICNKGFHLCGWYLNQKDKEARVEDDADADGFPDWVRPMVEAFLQFDFVRELPAFTTAAFKNSESVRHHWGGSLANGLYDTGPKGIKFSVFRGPNSDQYREASYTWAGFVRRCRAAGLEPGLREKEEPPRPRPGDVYRSPKSGQLYKIGELTNGKKTCYLTMRSNAQGGTWVPVNSSVYPKLSDAQGEFEAWIRTERLEPVAPTGAAAATTDGSAAPEPPQAAETTTTSESGAGANSCGTPAPAAQPSSEPPAELAPTAPMNLPAFDYSGLDVVTVDTLHLAENIIRSARQKYIVDLAGAVDMAHEELVRNSDGHNQHTEETFVAWCRSVGISKTTAYQLLQVQALITGATPEEQAVLEAASPSLLYAAAKPSAPAELVQAVKDGDITTHKQYQEALAEIRARDAKINDLLEMSEAADRRADKAEQAAKDTARERDTALRRAAEAEKQRDGARDALAAAKLRGDKLKAENDALKAHPIEAQVVDEEEIDRRAQARANELTAPLREELEALRNRHPADLEEAEQAIRDAYDSAVYTGRVIESAWRSLCPLLPRMDADRRDLALNQIVKIISTIQGECIQCL